MAICRYFESNPIPEVCTSSAELVGQVELDLAAVHALADPKGDYVFLDLYLCPVHSRAIGTGERLFAALRAAKHVLDCIDINGVGDYLDPLARDALVLCREFFPDEEKAVDEWGCTYLKKREKTEDA